MLNSILLLLVGSFLSMAASGSLLFKSEAVRGGGRIVLGVAWVLMSIALWLLAGVFGAYSTLVTTVSVMLGVSALVTLGSGVRKYLRRNLPA
ncbi:MAG: hypothetical protein IPP57_09320 [Candidatus Obscuribacter sp.]|nr:hypothetical protein [Candidatus Obscuribacter sp.]